MLDTVTVMVTRQKHLCIKKKSKRRYLYQTTNGFQHLYSMWKMHVCATASNFLNKMRFFHQHPYIASSQHLLLCAAAMHSLLGTRLLWQPAHSPSCVFTVQSPHSTLLRFAELDRPTAPKLPDICLNPFLLSWKTKKI